MQFLHQEDEQVPQIRGRFRPHHAWMTLPIVYDTLARTPVAIRALVTGATPEAMTYRESPGAWTLHEVLCHVTDGEVTDWRPRVAAIMSREDKRFTPFDRVGGQKTYGRWPTGALLDEFERLRRDNLTYLAQLNLAEADLERTGIHPEFGSVTLGQLLSCWVVHDLAHISQLSRILVRHFGPDVGPWTKYFSLLADREAST